MDQLTEWIIYSLALIGLVSLGGFFNWVTVELPRIWKGEKPPPTKAEAQLEFELYKVAQLEEALENLKSEHAREKERMEMLTQEILTKLTRKLGGGNIAV